jgi:flagellin-like protein
MNFEKVQRKNRKAISPVLATVILIAITLIAAIAIAGFVFGLFGSFTSTAQVASTSVNLSHGLAATGLAGSCASGGAGGANTVVFSNTGSASATVNSLSLTYGGQTATLALGAAACNVVSGGQMTITLTALAAAGTAGSQFTGSVAMSNGGQVSFTGAFQ